MVEMLEKLRQQTEQDLAEAKADACEPGLVEEIEARWEQMGRALPPKVTRPVPKLDKLLVAATARQPALPKDYIADPRIHFLALAQLQRFIAAALLQRSLPGEESRLRKEARTVWSVVSFAEKYGIDLEPLLATVGPPPTERDGWPERGGRLEQRRSAIAPAPAPEPRSSWTAPAGPSPSCSAEEAADARQAASLAAALLLTDAAERRLEDSAARRAEASVTRADALGPEGAAWGRRHRAAAKAAAEAVAERARGAEEAAEAQRWEEARDAPEDDAAAGGDFVVSDAWPVPELFQPSAEHREHCRKKAAAQQRREKLEQQAVALQEQRAARERAHKAELEAMRAERLARNMAWDDDDEYQETRAEWMYRLRRRAWNRGSNVVILSYDED